MNVIRKMQTKAADSIFGCSHPYFFVENDINIPYGR